MTKSTISDAYKVQRSMLRVTGAWPEEHSTALYILRGVINWILSLTLCVIMWMEVIHDINDFSKLSEILYVAISSAVYLVKLFCLTYHRKSFIYMINSLNKPIVISYSEDIDHYMAKTIKLSVFLGKSYRIICLCCMIMYAVYPLLDNKKLPFPFPYELGRYNYMMYILQLISVYCACWNASAMDTLNISLLGVAAAQLDVLSAKIVQVLDNDKDAVDNEIRKAIRRKVIKRLQQCVKHHLFIIEFIRFIENIFSLAFFSQFIGSTFIICNTLFYFLLISEASSLFILLINYLIIIVIQLFMFCWFGNEVIVKSLKVADACYMSRWYKHGGAVRKYLFIIMERSRRPVVVTLFKVSNLSVEAFKSIIQWSYSCFALLLKLYYAEA